MNLCLSNLAWDNARDNELYKKMNMLGINGLEIAPTKLFGENPYTNQAVAEEFALYIKNFYNISIVSIQSIWYKRNESIFKSHEERSMLLEYTKKAIDFSVTIGCKNLVFGCPKNRIIENESQLSIAQDFFGKIGDYAFGEGVIVSVEPNPQIYGTNFLNTTREALDFCHLVNNEGLRVNLDFGTIIYNNESISFTDQDIEMIGHVHISEPYLKPIEARVEHKTLKETLIKHGYCGYISVEMGVSERQEDIVEAAVYLKEVFG